MIGPFRSTTMRTAVALLLLSLPLILLVDGGDLALRWRGNVSLQEAFALNEGRIHLDERIHDTALHDGAISNVFQPGQTLFFLAHLGLAGEEGLRFYQAEVLAVVLLTALLLGAGLARLTGGGSAAALALGASFLLGAPYAASLPQALAGSVYRLNHVLALPFVAGLLLLYAGPAPRRRLSAMAFCVAGATLFRGQYLLLMVLPLSIVLGGEAPAARFGRPPVGLILWPLLAVGVILGFQGARFGDPWETGYRFLYEGRSDELARRAAAHGLFSWRFLAENLGRTLAAVPSLSFDGLRPTGIVGHPAGNSLLFSQPILLLLPWLGRGWASPQARTLLGAALLVSLPAWLYHNPGYNQPGYMRLSLDYLPLWLAAGAAAAAGAPRPRVWAAGAGVAAAWAVAYAAAVLKLGVGV